METKSATGTVGDAIAGIEALRRDTESQSGLALSCSSALHRLHELLGHETEALRLRGAASGHLANVESVKLEIARVKALNPAPARGPAGQGAYRGERKVSWRDAAPGPVRNRGRKTMGRAGGR